MKSRSIRSSRTGGPGLFDLPRFLAWAQAIPACEHTFHTRVVTLSPAPVVTEQRMIRGDLAGSLPDDVDAPLADFADYS